MFKGSITDEVYDENQFGDHWFCNVMFKDSFNTQVKI